MSTEVKSQELTIKLRNGVNFGGTGEDSDRWKHEVERSL
jgi:hypothetical protein